MLLDEIAPAYDVCSRHAIWVGAHPSDVYQVARNADLGGPLLVRGLMGIRAVPAALAALVSGHRRATQTNERSIGHLPFTLVDEIPGQEFVLGIMGRFWTPTGGVIATTAEQFRHPPPAGMAFGIWNFRVTPSVAGTLLSTETRVRCGDSATLRQFLRYWRLIRFGSGLTRRSMLQDIRHKAEKRST